MGARILLRNPGIFPSNDIPVDSLVRQYLPVDYTDAFVCEVTGVKELSADEIMISFWTVIPGWVNALFKLRNLLVLPFGLDTSNGRGRFEELKAMIRAGNGNNGLTSVVAKSGNETVILLSDKHLDAYMSVFISTKDKLQEVTAITLVRYHNSLGRIYFFFIRPFHKVIVKSMLRGTLKK
jgi:hypothetical protein